MAKLGDGIETLIDKSMPFLFEKFGDLSALTEHGCLTVAQCALLIPAVLTSKRPGDASELAAHYMQLALLDIAHGELSPKHPETLLPYSQYVRMMEAGMYGIDGENLPLPTAGWLVSLDECKRWLQSKDIHINFEGLEAELLARNAPTEPQDGAVEPAKAGPLPLTTADIAFCFAGLRCKTEDEWKTLIGKGRDWVERCLVQPGTQGRGGAPKLWNPVLMGAALVRSGHAKTNSVRAKFQTQPLLTPWLDEWKSYEADNLDTN